LTISQKQSSCRKSPIRATPLWMETSPHPDGPVKVHQKSPILCEWTQQQYMQKHMRMN
jgi:hypothetical protein